MKELFISFVFDNGSGNVTIDNNGYGIIRATGIEPMEVMIDESIRFTNYTDMQTFQQFIELKTNLVNVMVTNFRRLE